VLQPAAEGEWKSYKRGGGGDICEIDPYFPYKLSLLIS
jgi:hypothetical protein